MADTRKDRRAPVSLKVRFKSATVDEFIEHYCKDVSRGGIFIKSSQPMAIGTLLKFQFQLKDESSLIKGVGRVVWTRSPEDAVADQPAGMGIKFIKMDNESKAIVDRIVDGQGDDGGAFDEGRATATQAETPSERPHAQTDNFFPEGEPAELPPPEDRTAVRQAAQFLAAALAEGGTDQANAREAEQKAEEARQRTAQIEAQRQAAAQKKPAPAAAGAAPGPSSLPSMIVDPTLGAKEGKPLTIPPEEEKDRDNTPTTLAKAPSELLQRSAASTTSFPPAALSDPPPRPSAPVMPSSMPAEGSKKSPLIPAAILVGILAVAAWAYQRKPAEVEPPVTAVAPAEPAAKAPEPTPTPVQPLEPTPSSVADAAVVEPETPPEPAPEQKLVEVEIKAVPADAEVLVAGEAKGKVPLKLSLPEGVPTPVTVRAPGYAESTQDVTATADQKKPVRFALLALPYVVRVNTTPPGAKITIGAKHGNAGDEIVLGTALKGMLGITARLAGHEVQRAPLKLEDFTQTADKMSTTVDLTLTPLPAAPAVPKPPRVRPAPVVDAAAPAAPAPAAEPAAPTPEPIPAEKPAAPAAPAAAPAEKPATPPAAAPAPAEKPAEKPAPAPAPAEKPAPAPTKPAEPEKLPENPFNG
jgi:uncharacterized protein (TIGR02266 family)